MAGEKNLSRLIAGMRPKLQDGVFVFTTLSPDAPPPAGIAPLMVFREAEGTTLILTEDQAQRAGVAATFRSRMITLEIHSSLEAVGFMAAIATRLAEAGMGVNPVSAFYHDHLFVPAERADEAVAILEEMARAGGAA